MGQSPSTVSTAEKTGSSLAQFYDEQFEKELAMQNLLLAQRRAIKLAERREQLSWETMAVGTTTVVFLVAGSIYKRKDMVIPIVPLLLGLGWRYDSAFGQQQETIRENAEKILRDESQRLRPIGGPITLREIDRLVGEIGLRNNNNV